MPNSLYVDSQFSSSPVALRQFRSGDVVSVRVAEVFTGNRFRIQLGGQSMTARSTLPLRAGQLIRVHIEKSAGAVTLRILQSDLFPSASNNSPLTPAEALVRAFIDASLALPPDVTLSRMRALLSRTKGNAARMARLYVDLVSRGAEPSADFIEAVDGLLHGNEDGEENSGNKQGPYSGDNADESSQNTPKDPDSAHSESNSENKANHKNQAKKTRSFIKLKSSPSSDECKSGFIQDTQEQPPLINILNNSPAKGQNWLFRKSRILLDGREVNITWKIKKGISPALAFTVIDGSRRMEFMLEGLNPVNLSVYSDEKTEISPEKWHEFCERISLKNIRVNDTIKKIEFSNGFSSGLGEAV